MTYVQELTWWYAFADAWRSIAMQAKWEDFYRMMGGDGMVWAWKRQMAREIEEGHRTRTGQRWNAHNWHQP
jgi:hypothetical protein